MTNTTDSNPPAAMAVMDFRVVRQGELEGFFTLVLRSGLVLRDCSLHTSKVGQRWVGLPSRSYQKADGTTGWQRLVDCIDSATRQRFLTAALAAVDRYLRTHRWDDSEPVAHHEEVGLA